MFDRVGIITYPKDKGSDDEMLETAIEAGAEECVSSDESHEFIANMEDFGTVRDALEEQLGEPSSAKIEWRAKDLSPVPDDKAETLIKLLDALDDHDDVQSVYGNYELSEAALEKLGS
jgi:transcriptional/translational regulatory protein YebC/TACO1